MHILGCSTTITYTAQAVSSITGRSTMNRLTSFARIAFRIMAGQIVHCIFCSFISRRLEGAPCSHQSLRGAGRGDMSERWRKHPMLTGITKAPHIIPGWRWGVSAFLLVSAYEYLEGVVSSRILVSFQS